MWAVKVEVKHFQSHGRLKWQISSEGSVYNLAMKKCDIFSEGQGFKLQILEMHK